MQHVPQFLDTEDKIVGPLTWKHLYWFFGAGAILMVLWQLLDKGTFYFFAVIIALIAVVFAFYRPQGMTMIEFSFNAIIYFFQPKTYMWQRERHTQRTKKVVPDESIAFTAKGNLDEETLHGISETVDSHGQVHNERLDAILRDRARKAGK